MINNNKRIINNNDGESELYWVASESIILVVVVFIHFLFLIAGSATRFQPCGGLFSQKLQSNASFQS